MEKLKEQAAQTAILSVKSGMRLGLGSGSTTHVFIRFLGEMIQKGQLERVVGVATSTASENLARSVGIPLVSLSSLDNPPRLDLAVDGADEVDPQLNLIKGLGKALLREKLVEIHAEHLLIIVDESKLVSRLGRGPLPVEIVPFEHRVTLQWLTSLADRADVVTQPDGSPWITDNGNYLAHLHFNAGIPDLAVLAETLKSRVGVVEHGLFLNMAHEVIVASQEGIRILDREALGQ